MNVLKGKQVLLGITGSVAAYKSADLVRKLREKGAIVRVVMTENATRFITPLTMQAVSGFPIHESLFDLHAEAAMGHIELARWADLVLVAPASAEFIARLAEGRADDLLTTLCSATKAPIAIAPAMNQGMWKHALTASNIAKLKTHGVAVLGPTEGSQACGDVGPGRMLEPSDIITALHPLLATGALAGQRVLITAGPTHEAIDPVRFITNGSSGKMGYALATAALEAGASVILITGPVALTPPHRTEVVKVINAAEMHQAVMERITESDIFLGVSAVSDFRPVAKATHKIPKENATLTLSLERTEDIIESIGKLQNKPFLVGFAAETENILEKAKAKLQRKNLDMIIANDATLAIGQDENEVTVLTPTKQTSLPRTTKTKLAHELIALIAKEVNQRLAQKKRKGGITLQNNR
jgi:phosphopantothenoylcysteine decarboxylase / phosphopantothenate---cysteine ligase